MSNFILDTIAKRQSFRAFDGNPIPQEILESIVQAGLQAPSGMNKQPWHITVIQDPALLDEIYQAMRQTPGPGGRIMDLPKEQMMRNAPVLVLVSSEDAQAVGADAGLEAGLVSENMLIAAASYGIMGGWHHMIVKDFFQNAPGAALRDKLIPSGYTVQSAIFYGYPSGEKAPRSLREGTVTWL